MRCLDIRVPTVPSTLPYVRVIMGLCLAFVGALHKNDGGLVPATGNMPKPHLVVDFHSFCARPIIAAARSHTDGVGSRLP